MFRVTRPYLKFSAYPSYFISFFSASTVLEHHAQYIKCKQNSWSPLPNLFHKVAGNPKHTITFLGSRMHVSFTSCMHKKYFWSTWCVKKNWILYWQIKNPKPPPGQSWFLLLNAACFNSREATHTNFIVFGLTRAGLYPMDLTHSRQAC